MTRAGEQNAPLIDEILSLKQKQAKLLGFESYADVSLASKMAASVAEIEELHELLAAKATPAAHRELKELKEYAFQGPRGQPRALGRAVLGGTAPRGALRL